MKRTPIGYDNANALSDMLGIPEGSTWQSGGAPFDDAGAGPAVAAASSGFRLGNLRRVYWHVEVRSAVDI
jgi:hypothetical protein